MEKREETTTDWNGCVSRVCECVCLYARLSSMVDFICRQYGSQNEILFMYANSIAIH